MSRKNAYDNVSNVDIRIVSGDDGTEPITTAEAKNYLRLDWSDSDEAAELALLTTQITNARKKAERFLNSDIIAKSREVYYDYLDEEVNLYYAPYDSDETFTVEVDGTDLDSDEYELIGLDNPKLRLDSLPAEKVKISYSTKGLASNEIKFGVLAILWGLYYGRDGDMKGNYKHLLYPFKNFGYYGIR